MLIDIDRREIAIDAVADLIVLGPDLDRFRNAQTGVGIDFDIALEVEDALVGSGPGAKNARQDEESDGEPEALESHGHDLEEKSTLTGPRAAGSSISKNSAFSILNWPATILLGNCTTLVFSSRTTPL